jgi:hypothetical protein
MNDENGTPQIRVAPRINLSLGGMYQFIMLIGALIGAGLAIVSIYYTLAERVSSVEQWRLMVEDDRKQERRSMIDFEAEMRTAIGKVSETLSEIRERYPPRRNGP